MLQRSLFVGLLLVVLACPALCGMLGGFSSVANHSNDASVSAAKDVALKQIAAKLGAAPLRVEVLSAERQLVAGLNYRLKLQVTAAGGATKYFQAQIWEKLPAYGGAMELTHLDEISEGAATAASI